MESMQRVKIVGTLGPASSTREVIRALIEAGLDVARLNFSHGEREEHERVFRLVREEAEKAGATVAVLADLSGPKIRTRKVRGGAINLVAGQRLTITNENIIGDTTRISTTYTDLWRDVKPEDRILLDDGSLELGVVKINGEEILCEVIIGGVLKDKKGMNVPGTPLSVPALTDKDRTDLAFARNLGVDFLALSFVRQAEDVLAAKELADGIPVIAKIEKPEAVANLDAIIRVADGLMVARGDLGVEAGAEKVPLLQKRIIRDASNRGLPVIVATQMMESMTESPRPTRAEVSDVANAVLDGTDAVMLSAETASGKYPIETVTEMAAVLAEVETSDIFRRMPEPVRVHEHSFSSAVARAAVTASLDLGLRAIAVYTESGHSAALVSACRPQAVIVAFSRHDSVLRRLALRWGTIPLRGKPAGSGTEAVEQAEQMLRDSGIVRSGDHIAVTYGQESGVGSTDTLRLTTVR